MTFDDAVEVFSQCVHHSAELVKTARSICDSIVLEQHHNTHKKCQRFARLIAACRARLESAIQSVEETPDEFSDRLCLTPPLQFNPFIWHGHPWTPAASVVLTIAEDLIADCLEFEEWEDPSENGVDDEHRLETCKWLLEQWPADLHQRLVILRGQLLHEAGQIPASPPMPDQIHSQSLAIENQSSSSQVNSKSSQDGPTKNGPVHPDGFHWEGKFYHSIPPIPWKLLKYCWNSKDQSGSYDGMAEAVWGDRNAEFAGEPVKQAAKKLRVFFKTHHIPLTCINSEKLRSVTIKGENSKKIEGVQKRH